MKDVRNRTHMYEIEQKNIPKCIFLLKPGH